MKQIQLTQGQVALVDDEDFERLNQFKWYAWWHPRTRSYYAVRNAPQMDGRRQTVFMHREIMGATSGEQIDHKHHETLDNRKEKLRRAAHAENMHNHRIHANNHSGFKGVGWHKKAEKWQAQIKFHGRVRYIGLFLTPEDAARSYDAAAIQLHGEFAFTNKMMGLL